MKLVWASGALAVVLLTVGTLLGNAGMNLLNGGGGGDAIYGKGGMDTLPGGGGADRFYFDTTPGAGNVDLITDFLPGTDRIYLDDDAFTGIGPVGVLDAAAFVAGVATTAAQRIIYDAGSGSLYFDADGSSSGAAPLQFATLGAASHPVISAANFQITGCALRAPRRGRGHSMRNDPRGGC